MNWLKEIFVQPRLSVDEQIELWKRSPQAAMPSPDTVVMKATVTESKILPRLLTTDEFLKHYGVPGDPENLTTIATPFVMRLAWDPEVFVTKITCHKKIAGPLTDVLRDLLSYYGVVKLRELEIDKFGGCFNYRPMRGLEKKYEAAIRVKNFKLAYTYLSRHAWAGAIDLNPEDNDLKTKAPKAQFSGEAYRPMRDIFSNRGFIGYGPARNNDYMHWEIGTLL